MDVVEDDNDNHYFLLELEQILDAAHSWQALYQAIVDAPFADRLRMTMYGLGIIELLKVRQETHTIDRIALSDNDLAKAATRMSTKAFEEIRIPTSHLINIVAKAIRINKPQRTSDWRLLLTPELTAQEARFNQAGAGIDCSFVYPILKANYSAALIFSYFEPHDKLGPEQHEFMEAYTRLVSKKLS